MCVHGAACLVLIRQMLATSTHFNGSSPSFSSHFPLAVSTDSQRRYAWNIFYGYLDDDEVSSEGLEDVNGSGESQQS